MGCKNDNLPCVDDQLSEVPALQRGVEVRLIIVTESYMFITYSTQPHRHFILKQFIIIWFTMVTLEEMGHMLQV